jgi:hypothetical protein
MSHSKLASSLGGCRYYRNISRRSQPALGNETSGITPRWCRQLTILPVSSSPRDTSRCISHTEVSRLTVSNIEVTLPGTSRAGEIVVIGAHYDTVKGCPGANDNATGIAALLALARRFASRRHVRTTRLSGAHGVSGAGRGRSSRDSRRWLVRSLVVLASRLSGNDGDGHRTLSLPLVPHQSRHSG